MGLSPVIFAIKKMKTIIAEKPSVAKEIAKIVKATKSEDGYMSGNGYAVTWAYGHLITLQSPEFYGWKSWDRGSLPMIPRKFEITPVLTAEKKTDPGVMKQLKVISSLFRKSDEIIVATDAGREGELIFRYIYRYLQEKDGIRTPFRRLWISSLTDKAIRDGLADLRPGSDYDRMYEAGRARSEADWLIGMNATRAATVNAGGKTVWSVGRVQTPTLAMVCRRFIENRDFKAQKFYTVKVMTVKDGISFAATNPTRFDDGDKARETAAAILAGRELETLNVEVKPGYVAPPLLYDLTALQKDANKRFNMSADSTLKTCQALYEKKYVTYPRTGSRYIPDDVYDTLPSLISNAEKYPRFSEYAASLRGKSLARGSVNASKVTDHHALLPTENTPKEDALGTYERKIYELILGRMLESVSERQEKENTVITLATVVKGFPLTAKGTVVRKPGWTAVFHETPDDDKEEGGLLPAVTKGDRLPVSGSTAEEKFTKAPSLLTENTLLALMETAGKELEDEEEREAMKDTGIGTPATRAEVIEKLIRTKYMERDRKNLIPTEKGLALYAAVKDMRIADVRLTGMWESTLARIEQGKASVNDFNQDIRKYTEECTGEILGADIDRTAVKESPGHRFETVCPRCGSRLICSEKACFCQNKEGCGFFFYRIVCGRRLTENDIAQLLAEGRTKGKVRLKKMDGKTFEARLVLGENGKINLEFK